MGEIYHSRKAPHPLGSVKFEEIEARAREKLKDIPGQLPASLTSTRMTDFQY